MYHALYGPGYPKDAINPEDRFYAVSEEHFENQLTLLANLENGIVRPFRDVISASKSDLMRKAEYITVLTYDDCYEKIQLFIIDSNGVIINDIKSVFRTIIYHKILDE